jgi:hypothetical protein
MAAECSVTDGCLRCVDPKGRVGVDCGADYQAFSLAGYGGGGINMYLGSCSFTWGVPGMASLTCHYPGTHSCVANLEEDDWHCLTCMYRDGSGGGICSATSSPLPDPFADRPRGLPAPGTCATAQSRDGTMTCTTCTRPDLSATMICQVPAALSCGSVLDPDDPDCPLACDTADGGSVPLCYRAPGAL